MLPFISEGESEELVDGILGFGPEPLQQVALSALLARADYVPPYELYAEILGAGGGQPLGHRAQLLLGARAQPMPQFLPAPSVGEIEQRAIIDTEERALQYRCKRQIVLRQEQKSAQCDQVLHGELFSQDQPVGPGDRDAALLQSAQ